jgi:hypothetical protein
MNKVVTVGTSQSIFDIALQYSGDVSKCLEIIQNNSQIDNMETDLTGKSISVNVIDNSINLYFKNRIIGCKYPEIRNGYILTDDGDYVTDDDGNYITID